jgi:hypothetical protein
MIHVAALIAVGESKLEAYIEKTIREAAKAAE